MLRLLTAGESHGKGLVADPRGPARRRARRAGGRGGRAGPAPARPRARRAPALRIRSVRDPRRACGTARTPRVADRHHDPEPGVRDEVPRPMGVEGEEDPSKRLTRPRPGHADLAGAQKYGFDDVRNVLERASARETAARVALGAFCKAFLGTLDVDDRVARRADRQGQGAARRRPARARRTCEAVDRSPVRCFDPEASAADGGRDRPAAEGARHARRGLRGPRVRGAARPRLLRPLRPQARCPPRAGADEHPVRQGRRGRRRVRDGGASGVEGARRDRAARRRDRAAHRARRAGSRAA